MRTNLLTSSVITISDHKTGMCRTDTIMKLTYDDLGHVIVNHREGSNADMSYEYDLLHGWINRISSSGGFDQHLYRETTGTHTRWNGSISAMTWKTSSANAVRKYDYTYDGLNRLLEGKYTEGPNTSLGTIDIGGTQSGQSSLTGIASTLDLLPSLPGIGGGGVYGENRYTEKIWYDKNSNITQLQRYGKTNQGTYGLIDDLMIDYDGNQKVKVEDAA